MLQQTRVEAVKPYYERFLKALPDVAALAACPEDQLMKLWEGLGYYNRVRNMQKAAVTVTEEYDGLLPADYGKLLELKGIGSYTAGAIASIAYGIPVPAVDGNVLRILTRVATDDTDIMKQSFRSAVEAQLGEMMRELTVPEELRRALRDENVPGALNQAMMELGATVCVPNGAPLCEECPWSKMCLARAQGRVMDFPVKSKAKARRIEERTVLVIRDGEKVAIRKRPKKGLLAGLYELPNLSGALIAGGSPFLCKGTAVCSAANREACGCKAHIFPYRVEDEWICHSGGGSRLCRRKGTGVRKWAHPGRESGRGRRTDFCGCMGCERALCHSVGIFSICGLFKKGI